MPECPVQRVCPGCSHTADVTPERLATAVDTVTGDPGYRDAVAAMGKEAAASGTQKAADLVESAAAR